MAGAKDRIKGKVNEVAGAARKNVGRLVGDETIEAEGIVQEATGKVQAIVGKAKHELSQ